MKNTAQFYNNIEIVILTATFNGAIENVSADLYKEANKSFLVAVPAGACAPANCDKVGTTILNPTEKVVLTVEGAQENSYKMIDDCGRIIGHVYASNIKDASRKAIESKTPRLWKVQRCYNGGVRG